MLYSTIVNTAFKYVVLTSKQFNIDESHAVRHSMDAFHFANKIYDSEIYSSPFLKGQKNIIMCSAILHDMCDKKYVSEKSAIIEMNSYMKEYLQSYELDAMNSIISSMSYSTVKKNGYPNLDQYNLAYHIVRESDLLSAYDVERCIMYQMMHDNDNYFNSLKVAKELFKKRIFNYIKDDLFVTEYSKNMAKILDYDARTKLSEIDTIYRLQV
jgi:hypothetical protein